MTGLILFIAIIGVFSIVIISWVKRDEVDEDILGYACAFWWFIVGALVILGIVGLGQSLFGEESTLYGIATGLFVFYVGHKYFCKSTK